MSFPVIFFDGEQETNLGNVVITPSLNFKVFQSMISEKLVLSPHQFSVYLSDRKNHGFRVPITGKVDFSAISCEKDCFFLVVLKRSRRDRRRQNSDSIQIVPGEYYDHPPPSLPPVPPANMMLLRRDGNSIAINVDYGKRVKELQLEKERYLMNMGLGFGSGTGSGFDSSCGQEERFNGTVVSCEECLRAKKMGFDVGFHWCVYDTVTFGFKSPAGPIARPAKESG